MKTRFAALLIALCGWMLVASSAKASLIIGTVDGGNCYPFGCNDSGLSVGQSIHFQQIYSSTAFSGPINIESLTFYSSLLPGNILSGNYVFHLSTAAVSLFAMSTTLADNIGADNALFFSGSLGTGSLAFTVTGTPFYYEPALGDLLLDIVVNDQDNVPNSGSNGYNDAVGSPVTVTQRGFAVGNSGGVVGTGALVTGFNAAPVSVPVPGTLALIGLSLAVLVRARKKKQR